MKVSTSVILSSSLVLFSCASPKRAELQSSNPQEVISSLEKMKSKLVSANVDVLAKNHYEEGSDDLEDAREAIEENDSQEEVMNELAEAKAHYEEAQKIAESRKVVPESILNARKKAIESNVLTSHTLREKLDDIDDSLRHKSKNFTVSMTAEDISSFQSKYLSLEIEGIQHSNLGVFREIIKKAKRNDAKDLAPKTFRAARSNLKIAENLIEQSPRGAAQYEDSVDKANRSVKLLDDVMSQLTGEAKGASEDTALKLVYQERKLGKLSDKVNNLEGSIAHKNSVMGMISKDLINKNNEVLSSRNKIRFQRAMNQVRSKFSENEANVYQQGDKLIIRIKEIGFKKDSATVPTESMDLLSKINSIVMDLNPKGIVIEGHTDSTGPEDYNLMLSNKRAESVKEYFTSLDVSYDIDARGYGETKPIANNESKDGRSLNRRVDIVVNAEK